MTGPGCAHRKFGMPHPVAKAELPKQHDAMTRRKFRSVRDRESREMLIFIPDLAANERFPPISVAGLTHIYYRLFDYSL